MCRTAVRNKFGLLGYAGNFSRNLVKGGQTAWDKDRGRGNGRVRYRDRGRDRGNNRNGVGTRKVRMIVRMGIGVLIGA